MARPDRVLDPSPDRHVLQGARERRHEPGRRRESICSGAWDSGTRVFRVIYLALLRAFEGVNRGLSPFKRVLRGDGLEVLDFFLLFMFLWFFSLRPDSTVHCIYGFFPPRDPGQDPGPKSGKKKLVIRCLISRSLPKAFPKPSWIPPKTSPQTLQNLPVKYAKKLIVVRCFFWGGF